MNMIILSFGFVYKGGNGMWFLLTLVNCAQRTLSLVLVKGSSENLNPNQREEEGQVMEKNTWLCAFDFQNG